MSAQTKRDQPRPTPPTQRTPMLGAKRIQEIFDMLGLPDQETRDKLLEECNALPHTAPAPQPLHRTIIDNVTGITTPQEQHNAQLEPTPG